jgi:hypothetical protein
LLVEVESANSQLVPMQTRALGLARKQWIKTTILRVKFNVKFAQGELYEVNSSRDVRAVNNLPTWNTELGIVFRVSRVSRSDVS